MKKKYSKQDLEKAYEEGGYFYDWEQRGDMDVEAPQTIEQLTESLGSYDLIITYLSPQEMLLQSDPIKFDDFEDLIKYLITKHKIDIGSNDFDTDVYFAISLNETDLLKITNSVSVLHSVMDNFSLAMLHEDASICVNEFNNATELGEFIAIYFDKQEE